VDGCLAVAVYDALCVGWGAGEGDFLSSAISISKRRDHHGGTGYGLMVSIGVAWSGNVLARYSKEVTQIRLREEVARRMGYWCSLHSQP